MKTQTSSPYLKAFNMTYDYFFHSKTKLKVWLLFSCAIISVIILVILASAFTWWMTDFFAALSTMNLPSFISSLQSFALITIAWIAISIVKDYCVETLCGNWRKWLMEKMIPKYITGKINYLDLYRHSEQIDNPEQRIQEDAKSFVKKTIALTIELLNSALTLIAFTGSLWVIGGSISFVIMGLNIIIPGYMFWAAIGFAALASFIIHKIGQRLIDVNQKEETLEANVRKDLFALHKDAESIAQEQGEKYYQKNLLNKFQEICQNWNKKIFIKLGITSFNSFYQQITFIFPYIVAAPAYYAGLISLPHVLQISFIFSQIQNALSWFINSYEMLASYKSNTIRLIELDNILEKEGLKTNARNIIVRENNSCDGIECLNIDIGKPQKEVENSVSSTNLIMSQLNLKLPRHINTVILGANGLGKSTIFKVIAGTWKYGTGQVNIPNRNNLYFVPQKPTMIHDTLRCLLAYPDSAETFTDNQYREALCNAKIEKLLFKLQVAEEKSVTEDWSKLSGGEQQKIGIARSLLRKRKYLFLDEATSAMTVESENHIYNLRKSELKDVTIISIAHRNVLQHHDRAIILDLKEEQRVQLQEKLLPVANDETLFEHCIHGNNMIPN